MTALPVLLGTGLIALGLRDIFQTLFHPSANGRLSRHLTSTVWRAAHYLSRRGAIALTLAGPTAMLAVIAAWVVLLIVGWALILWPFLPEAVLLVPGLDAAAHDGFDDALYVSLVTLTTLGYGDIAPQAGWLRLLLPLEAVVGFGLLTAAISWMLTVYPVLARRRLLAREVFLLRGAETNANIDLADLDPNSLERLLAGLSERLLDVRGDLVHFPITYYFHDQDRSSSLAAALPEIARLVDEIADSAQLSPAPRLRLGMLRDALEELAEVLGREFLNQTAEPRDEVLAAYARDHQVQVPRTRGPSSSKRRPAAVR